MKENSKLLRLLKSFSGLLMILSFVFQTGTLFVPSRAFGFAKDPFDEMEIDFSQNKASGVRVVFFEREGRSLFPKCQVPVERYPGILPGFVSSLSPHGNKGSHPNSAASFLHGSGSVSEFDGLEDCGLNLSLELANRAEHFSLYPKVAVAFVPLFIVLANVSSCAVGAAMGGAGGFELAEELETGHREKRNASFERQGFGALSYFPTKGEMLTGVGPVGGAALGTTTNYAYIGVNNEIRNSKTRNSRIHKKFGKFAAKTGARAGGAVGFICGVAGGLVGYFSGKSNIAHQKMMEANEKTIFLKASLSDEKKHSQALQKDLDSTMNQNQALQNALDRENIRVTVLRASLSETKRHLQILQENLDSTSNQNQALQNALNEANTRVENLQSDLNSMQEINSLIGNVLGLRDEIEGALADLEIQSSKVVQIAKQEREKTNQLEILDHELKEKQIHAESLKANLASVKEWLSNLELALETGFDDIKAVSLLELERNAQELQQDVELAEKGILSLEGNLTEGQEELSLLTEQRKEFEEFALEIYEIHVNSTVQRKEFEEFLRKARRQVQEIQQSLQEASQRISNLLKSDGDVESK